MIPPPLAITDTLIDTVANASPPVSPLTLDYAKLHIRALGTADDALIAVYIRAAASYFENQTGRQLLTARREAWLDAFPFIGASGLAARIELPHPPLQTVDGVRYVDGDGVLQTVDPSAFRSTAPAGAYAVRGTVEPVAGQSWPMARLETGAVRIAYTCGYGDTPDDMPDLVRGILCYLVGHYDTFRTAVHEARRGQVLELPYGVQMMMDGFKHSALPSQVLRAIGIGAQHGIATPGGGGPW